MTSSPIRVGVVSDTHLFTRSKALPKRLLEGLRGVDLILHAGDFTDPRVVEMLEAIAFVEGVAGNNDPVEIVRRYGYSRLLTVGTKRIGLVHGHAGPGRSTEWNAWHRFRDDGVDAVVFGHSHAPFYEWFDGVLMFNPGSPTDKRFQPRYSFGLMEIGRRIEAVHVFFDDRS